MADLRGVLGYYQLTGLVNELNLQGYEEAPLSRNVPGRQIVGDTITWHVRKPRINLHKIFMGPDSAAVPLDFGDVSMRAMTIPYRFVSKRWTGGDLNAIARPGTEMNDDGKALVATEVREMDILVRQLTNEWLVAQVLQGSFTIKYGNPSKSVSETINFGIPAGNQFTVGTLWTNTSADILEDIRVMKERLKKRGARPAMMLMNDYTANLIHKNTTIQTYIKEYNAGRQIVELGSIPPLLGMRTVVVDTLYADEDQFDSFEKYLIPNGKVIFIPEWPAGPGGWIEMDRGSFLIPNNDGTDLQSVAGVAVWSETQSNPPCKMVFERVLEFPLLREPWVVGIMTVT